METDAPSPTAEMIIPPNSVTEICQHGSKEMAYEAYLRYNFTLFFTPSSYSPLFPPDLSRHPLLLR